jgi:replicative DNA helicase
MDTQSYKGIYSSKELIERLSNLLVDSHPENIPSGFKYVDQLLGGFHPGNLIIIATRPWVGKTIFALNVVRNVAVDQQIPTAFFTLGESGIQIAKKLATQEGTIDMDKIEKKEDLTMDDLRHFEEHVGQVANSPLFIDDTPEIGMDEFKHKARMLVREKGVRLIVIDNMQEMYSQAPVSQALKEMARELYIPIISTFPIYRIAKNSRKYGGRPSINDLRTSHPIDDDADAVILIHRPDVLGLSDNP